MVAMTVYESRNSLVRSVTAYFSVKKPIWIEWEQGAAVGGAVSPGVKLATVQYDDPDRHPDEDMIAPPGCVGVIEWRNDNITYEYMHRDPQDLLKLETENG